MHYVDGLRAIAALLVALYHFQTWVGQLVALLPAWIDAVLKRGYLGVQIFFVLSGFVISHSLRNTRFSLSVAVRFALRRQLRLDPPYWIVLAISAAAFARTPGYDPARISAKTLLAHVAYLQNILGYPNLLDVFWTLAIEVQLYLAFVALSWMGQAKAQNGPGAQSGQSGQIGRRREILFAVTTLASLVLAWFMDITVWRAWFVVWWYMFALGVWARWALSDARARRWLALFVVIGVVRSIRFHGPGPALCVVTALLLYGAARLPSIARSLGARPLAALGRVSYSFYLLHAVVGGEVLTRVLRTGPPSALRDTAAVLAALGASIAAATVFYYLVENPAMALSRRVQLRSG